MLPVSILDTFQPYDEELVNGLLAEELKKSEAKLVVLDDDPTGVQSVHDISVYTDWSPESLEEGFAEEGRLFYVLTNSRSFTAAQTEKVHREIASAVSAASKASGKPYVIFSRSDSTLRGHYPLETEVLRECIEVGGKKIDGEIMCPFFLAGGRYTIGNVHYVKQGEWLVPAAETEFARDKTFGYTRSAIPEYIEEKTSGRYKAEDVTCISLEQLRGLDLEGIQAALESVTGFNKVCVNAVSQTDLKVFAIAIYRAMAAGKRFMFRTAADLVKVMGGVSDRPLLTRNEMVRTGGKTGGIVVVGSHTEKTTAQLNELLKLEGTVPVEFDSDLVLRGPDTLAKEAERCAALEEDIINAGKTAVCYTRRRLLTVEGDTPEKALLRSVAISEAVQSLVARLAVAPAFIIAKGGITSSDIGTKALKVKKALVLGQIQPGIPVWQTGPESRFPGTPYVIFPGNTGDETTLRKAAEVLMGK